MYLNVYKITFNKTSQELEDLYDDLSIIDQEKLLELSTESYFDYDGIEGNYTVFFISSPIDIEKYIEVLESNYIKTKCLNITNDLLNLKYNLEIDLKHLVDKDNELKFEFFIDDLNDWLLENLDIDVILDKISEVGIENIGKIEKKFLENYKL